MSGEPGAPTPPPIEDYARALAALLRSRAEPEAAVLARVGLTLETFRLAEARWAGELATAFARRRGVVAMRFAEALGQALCADPAPPGESRRSEPTSEPRPAGKVELPSFARASQAATAQETQEIDRAALARLVVPFRPGPATLPEAAAPAGPASDGDTLPMPGGPAAHAAADPKGSARKGLAAPPTRLSWREHARLRAAIDAETRRVAALLAAAGLDAATFAEEERAWRERLARDPVLRAQWRAAYEHAASHP